MLANEAANRIDDGYYSNAEAVARPRRSLCRAIRSRNAKNAVIAEIKFGSPSHGKIRTPEPAERLAEHMVAGGACALSVLTASGSFAGDISSLARVSRCVELPVLMKDIVISPVQLHTGARMGADAVVLISEVYSNGLSEYSLTQMRSEASKVGLECLLEASSPTEFSSLADYKPDLYGVNNRDLSSLKVDLETTGIVLSRAPKPSNGPLVSESGIETPDDLKRLRSAGADAFLVGTSIMKAENVEKKVWELVNA